VAAKAIWIWAARWIRRYSSSWRGCSCRWMG